MLPSNETVSDRPLSCLSMVRNVVNQLLWVSTLTLLLPTWCVSQPLAMQDLCNARTGASCYNNIATHFVGRGKVRRCSDQSCLNSAIPTSRTFQVAPPEKVGVIRRRLSDAKISGHAKPLVVHGKQTRGNRDSRSSTPRPLSKIFRTW